MFSRIRFAKRYLQYYFRSTNGKGHGIHSPFVFDFVNHVLRDNRDFYAFPHIEALRAALLKDHTKLEIEDMGTGSASLKAGPPSGVKDTNRTVAEIAMTSAVPARLGRLLFRTVHFFQPRTILELGTSLGLSTSYLAAGNWESKVITIEGSARIAEVAKRNFEKLGLNNIEPVIGNFDPNLALVLDQLKLLTGRDKIGLAFIDGNHAKDPVLKYFNMILPYMEESAVFILDDIHWSSGMEEAWTTIVQDPRVLLTVDLFFFGFVFLRKEFRVKQHFTIHYPN